MERGSLQTAGTVILVLLILTCGRKYPMPPESSGAVPAESSYVRVGVWPGDRGYTFGPLKDIAVGVDGFIYVADSITVWKFYTTGEPVPDFAPESLIAPVGVFQGYDRVIYVADLGDGRVKMLDVTGRFLGAFRDTTWVSFGGIAAGPSGHLYLTDPLRDLLLRYDPEAGILLDTVASYGNGILNVDDPHGVYVDRRGFIYVASTGHNWVEVFSPMVPPSNVLHLGGVTQEGGTDDTLFLEPVDVAADTGGYVYTLERGGGDFKRFTPAGVFLTRGRSPDAEERGLIPVALSVTPDGKYLYVAYAGEENRVEKYEKVTKPGGEEPPPP